MGSAIHVYRFRDGEVVRMDRASVREVLEPYAPYDVPEGAPVEWVLAADGSEADVDVGHGVVFGRPGPGVLDIIAELVRRTGASVLLLDGDQTVIVTSESDRLHLPDDLRANTVVVPPPSMTGRAIGLGVNPQPEQRRRPMLPPFPYHADPVGTGAVVAADETCSCCGHDQGWICTGTVHGKDVPDGRLCPYCVAFGTAAKRHGAHFNEVPREGLSQAAALTIRERTPAPDTLGDRPWPTHCGDGAVYVGEGAFRCRACGTEVAVADTGFTGGGAETD
ncbi:CbrC family protein [Streptomyces phaeoluteigriseus]|uniref:CbrC family protein n=1 Tax=Streptomyces phaeoluteigriseus TaxID=114686 RepID=A0ABY4ZIU2_9ACTN|nr:CbrC family protein [Streptomyces phaeoluteigriseus]USQ88916.1 CbrC family protein [Streptomyces phaeoluteigriseus]